MSHLLYNTQELLELAQLDVLGLLDADEREAFERSFRAASPEVQSQIRREQTRLAGSGVDSLLPSVETPLGLRARVLAAIREAMQTMTSASRVAEPAGDVVGRIMPDLAPSRGINRWWRAGAIGALAASIVFGFTALQMYNDNRELQRAQESNDISKAFLQEFGPRFETALLDPETKLVQFSPASSDSPSRQAKATLLVDRSNRTAQLFLKNFSGAVGKYTLVVVDENGNKTRAVLEFQATGNGVDHHYIDGLSLEGAGGLAIIQGPNGASNAPTVLKSTKL